MSEFRAFHVATCHEHAARGLTAAALASPSANVQAEPATALDCAYCGAPASWRFFTIRYQLAPRTDPPPRRHVHVNLRRVLFLVGWVGFVVVLGVAGGLFGLRFGTPGAVLACVLSAVVTYTAATSRKYGLRRWWDRG